tara:strand:+ start:549 stop:746 length:198 start_codon:yes stop_codon:yes gene_type:complete
MTQISVRKSVDGGVRKNGVTNKAVVGSGVPRIQSAADGVKQKKMRIIDFHFTFFGINFGKGSGLA